MLTTTNSHSMGLRVANGQGISLIRWYKDQQLESPIFSADARGAASLRQAKQVIGLDLLKARARLEESTRVDSRGLGQIPALVLEQSRKLDEGFYTCTVEFHKAPTQTHQIRVQVLSKSTSRSGSALETCTSNLS